MEIKFTAQAQMAIEYAEQIMADFRHGYLGTEHLLVGLIHTQNSVAQRALEACGITEEDILDKIKDIIGMGGSPLVLTKDFTPRVKRIFEMSGQIAKQIGSNSIGTEFLLIAILKDSGKKTASVPAKGFDRYAQVFKAYNFEVNIRDKESEVIYVSPSHMTRWGTVMDLSRRYEILEHSKKGHMIIEDDYQNELNFSKQVRPSIYALAGGENVVYLGSFSRLLLPSIRISFMILPKELAVAYERVAKLYDQTASKTEQLALASYLRDEHLHRQIKKIRKLYSGKRELLHSVLTSLIKDIPSLTVVSGDCGTEMLVSGSTIGIESLNAKLEKYRIIARKTNFSTDANNENLMFSCGFISAGDLIELKSNL